MSRRVTQGVGVRRLHGMGVQQPRHPRCEVVGVERRPGDVQGRRLVGERPADDAARRQPVRRCSRAHPLGCRARAVGVQPHQQVARVARR